MRTRGLAILARAMSIARRGSTASGFKGGRSWQYHPRSDQHSKIACWCIAFDMLRMCPTLQRHAADRRVGIGINHTMTDFVRRRSKDLDMVVCRAEQSPNGPSLRQLVGQYDIPLDDDEQQELKDLPDMADAASATVLVAMEAKACMTAFRKAAPRLHSELDSSHWTVHGDIDNAIAAGFAMVNAADTFVSPLNNLAIGSDEQPTVNRHRQPGDAEWVISKLGELPYRSQTGVPGFDAFGIVAVNCRNDGTPVTISGKPPIPSAFRYDQFVERLAGIYAARFSMI